MKIDCDRNIFIADTLVKKVPQIIRATVDCNENFGIDDVLASAYTDNKLVGFPIECKTLLGGWQFKYDGEWNRYFCFDIYDKLKFHGLPPEEGHPLYFINATDKNGDYEKGKWKKLLDNDAGLCYLGPDCIIYFDSKTLREAFLGYADYYVRHTTEYGGDYNRHWETKSLIDLTKGLYIPCKPNKTLFE